jgi:hypothetical protein
MPGTRHSKHIFCRVCDCVRSADWSDEYLLWHCQTCFFYADPTGVYGTSKAVDHVSRGCVFFGIAFVILSIVLAFFGY